MIYEWIPVLKPIQITILKSEMSSLAPEIQKKVEDLWSSESKVKDLYDGEILNFVDLQKEKLLCRIESYKHYFARKKFPELIPFICPIAVTAITQCSNKYLVGVRSERVFKYPKHWEFVPAGTLDSNKNPEQQILIELLEETGISSENVKEISLKFLLHNFSEPFLEFCYIIQVDNPKITLNSEYDNLCWKSETEIRSSFRKDLWVPCGETIFQKLVLI